ncbi:MAG: DJ-1/PfpI family protein [Kiritimatiellae bacterium]|nr:DJ-1/PfpI family protein [Kiritimatiellia bacterium]
MKKALVPLADGFEDIEAIAVIDVLRRGGIEVVTASLSQELSALSAHGIRMQTDALLGDVLADRWDAIILPGGGQGTANLMACEALAERLRAQKESGGYICAICAAPTVLAAAGVLEDEDVTCYPTCASEMDRPVVDVPAVADGQIITGRGPGSAITFAFAVLLHLAGEEVAHEVSEGMVAVI